MLNQSVMGAPFVSILQNDVSGKRLTKLFEKNGKIFGNSCTDLSKALSRADSGRNMVIGGRLWSDFQNRGTVRSTERDNASVG